MSLVPHNEQKEEDGQLDDNVEGPPVPLEASFNPASQPEIPQVADD